MSVEAMAWAKDQRTGSPTRKAVLLAIADYADEHGRAWPSQKRLCEDTELSERAVRNALAELEAMELIFRTPQVRSDNSRAADIIQFNMVETPRHHVPGVGHEMPGVGHVVPEGVGHDVPGPPAPRAGLTTFEPPIEEEMIIDAADAAVSEWSFDRFWAEYPYRVGKKPARIIFDRLAKRQPVPFGVLIEGLRRYKATKPEWQGWAHPATWLNQERWDDQPEPSIVAPSPSASMDVSDHEWAARLADFERDGYWAPKGWGPPPDDPETWVPPRARAPARGAAA